MAFQLVRGLFGRGSPPCSRTHGPTVENATGDDQHRETNYGISRDVQKSAESDWSQLARAMQLDVEGRNSHTIPNPTHIPIPNPISNPIHNRRGLAMAAPSYSGPSPTVYSSYFWL